jgi:hypothetical protein
MTENTNLVLDPSNATVTAVVNQIKSDMRGGNKYGLYVTEFGVTHETVKDHALALARLVTPETAQSERQADGTKTRTRFGNAVQAAGNGLRSALGKKAGTDTDWIRLVRQAVENAHNKGEIDPADICAAVLDALHMTDDSVQAA